MKDKVLFFITSEFPYGKGETFIEDEIRSLAEVFDKIFIIPTNRTASECRNVPANVFIYDLGEENAGWLRAGGKILSESKIAGEFFRNLFSNPLKNKILLKSVKNALTIFDHLEKISQENNPREKVYYSYWLDDGAIGIAFLNENSTKISRAHGWDVYFELHKHKYLPLRDFLSERLNKIFTISQNGKGYLDAKTGRPEKIAVSRLGTSNENDFADKPENAELNVISISGVIPLKRIHLIGGAAKLLDTEKVEWNHFGEGSLLDEIKKEFTHGVFHGHLENNKVKEYLKANAVNSILVNTSTTEGIPVSMMEAMSFGIPCLGTNVGGVSEIIKDGVNGFLMPSDASAETVAKFIRKYLDLTTEEKNRLRRNAYKTWDERYNAEKNYSKFTTQLQAIT